MNLFIFHHTKKKIATNFPFSKWLNMFFGNCTQIRNPNNLRLATLEAAVEKYGVFRHFKTSKHRVIKPLDRPDVNLKDRVVVQTQKQLKLN